MKRGHTGQRLMALGAVVATAGLLAVCGSSSKSNTSATTVASGGSASRRLRHRRRRVGQQPTLAASRFRSSGSGPVARLPRSRA